MCRRQGSRTCHSCARKATSRRTVGRRETGSLERRAVVSSKDDFIESTDTSNKYLEDKVVFDQSEETFHNLEGKLMEEDNKVASRLKRMIKLRIRYIRL